MLTQRQKAALNEIQAYITEHSYPPTIRELQDRMGVKSSSVAYNYVAALRRKGYLTWLPGSPRTLRILKKEA